jgi:hypothetical protein
MPRKATTKKTQNVEEKTSTLPQVSVSESPVAVVQQPVQVPVPVPWYSLKQFFLFFVFVFKD